MDFLLENLNDNQKRVVLHKDGPLLVLAGAGAGKTRAISHRVAHLVSQGVEPNRILAITFTNKAAAEMKERINSLLREVDSFANTSPFVSTFHALGVYILRKSGRSVGVPRDFSVLDKDDSLSLMKSATKDLGLDPKQFQPAKMQSVISRNKGDLIGNKEFSDSSGEDFFPGTLSKIWNRYEEYLQKQKALDFSDLIYKTVLLLQKDKEVREHYQNLWQYIMIDEYQDTNKGQYELSKILSAKHKNICVIGDIDQCLLPDTKISTPKGVKKISEIKKGEKVIAASGDGNFCESEVLRTKKRSYEGEIIEIKTKSGKKLKLTPRHIVFAGFSMDSEYPHYFPQGTARSDHSKKRVNLRITLFGDKRGTATSPWGLHRISINSADLELRDKLKRHSFKVRNGKKHDWRLEIARVDYAEIEEIVDKLVAIEKNLIVTKSAFLTKEKKFLFQPAANLYPSMKIASMNSKKEIAEDEIKSVKKETYKGDVYDLDINKVHNYIANGVSVHNCIYSWRGADYRNIVNFEKDYPDNILVVLEENYRSTQTILEAAATIIEKNKMRKPKRLIAKKEKGAEITLFEARNEQEEAEFVASKIKDIFAEGDEGDGGEVAVLYRANFQSRAMEEACLKYGVPYQILGTQFYQRKEVKDIFAFLRAAMKPESMLDIKRVINVPPRGIGKVTILNHFSGKKLSAEAEKRVAGFFRLLEITKEKIENSTPADAIRFVMRESGYQKFLEEGGDDDRERLENLKELVSIAGRYEGLPTPDGVAKLLEDAALMSDQDALLNENKNGKNTAQKAVRLMTVHSAKGLEFSNVFVVGLEDGLFPHKGFGDSGPEREEEERRLFYVAVTRAKEKLFLTFSLSRMVFGSKQLNIPSQFISDIPEHLIQVEERGKIEKVIRYDW